MEILIPLIIGSIIVVQGGMNRYISDSMGLAQTTLMGSALTCIVALGFYFFVKSQPNLFPEYFQVRLTSQSLHWWYIVPALFGFFIVIGIPLAIAKMGAVKVTIGLIGAQMITSVLWDIYVEKVPLNPQKIIGLVLAISSVLLITSPFANGAVKTQ